MRGRSIKDEQSHICLRYTTVNNRQKTEEKKTYVGFFFQYLIQHCFICRFSDPTSTVSEDAGIERRTVATSALAVRYSNHSARSHLGKKNLF
jgi:hypothetical protein